MAEGYHSSGGYLSVRNDEDSPLVCSILSINYIFLLIFLYVLIESIKLSPNNDKSR